MENTNQEKEGKAEKTFKDFGKKVDRFMTDFNEAGENLHKEFNEKFEELKQSGEKLKNESKNKERWKEVEENLKKALPVAPEVTLPDQDSAIKNASDIKNIPVAKFDIDHSDLLTDDELKQILSPYQGRDVSLKELFEAVSKINQLYDAKNIKTARAILPPQEVKGGIVKIQLVEARLGGIIISGVKDVRSGFVEDRIHVKPGELISVTKLEEDLIRFNALYEPKLRADVRAGAEVGKTDITIEVQEAEKYHLTTFADNAGRDTVGESRIGAIYKVNNLLGVNDSIQVVATGTSGSRSYGFSYSIPVSKDDMRLDVSYNYGNIN